MHFVLFGSMGNLVSSAGPRVAVAGIDSYVGELSEVSYEKSLGGARFLKTIRCRHTEGPVVVKIFVKPEPGLSLKKYVKTMQTQRDLLYGLPNILTNYLVTETERAGYMLRQFVASNLYDRISTRPFLTAFEKRWIAYQLLTAVVEAHSRQIYHGDIKTENVFVTTWNWIYLSDFSPYKPTLLPEDNPADFTFFFDTSARRACYLAPERFRSPNDSPMETKDVRITPEMDIFALGCTIGELFLEGTPLFTLSQLLRYRKDKYDPSPMLDRIENADVRALVKHMIQLNPIARLSAQEYLTGWRNKAFPEFFYTFMHPYLADLSDPYSAANAPQYHVFLANSSTPVTADSDAKIDQIYFDFVRIAEILEIPNPMRANVSKTSVLAPSTESVSVPSQSKKQISFTSLTQGKSMSRTTLPKSIMPVHVHIPGFPSNVLEMTRSKLAEEGCLILIAAVCASIRNTLYPTSRLRGIDLLLAMGIQVSDEHKLDRIVPYLVILLTDETPAVRTNALAALTQLLTTVKSIVPSDASIFPEYILPSVKRFTSDPDDLARAAYAQTIAVLAELSLHFLELSQLLKSNTQPEVDMDTTLYQISYDTSLRDIQETIQEDVVALLIDPNPIVKRSLLIDMPRLCIFFGRQKSNDVLLSHMITYLNDTDWMLRGAFCEAIVGVGTFMGMQSLEEYILPLMVQALTDSVEFVVEKVLNSLTSLAELGLMTKRKVHELCTTVLPLVCHPNRWIRFGAVAFLASAARILSPVDVRCVLYPMIRPFLRRDMPGFSEVHLLENLKAPLSRQLFEQMILLAAQNGHGGVNNNNSNSVVGSYSNTSSSSLNSGLDSSSGPIELRSGDRGELLERLKSLGMAEEDKEKLFAMKYFITKASFSRARKKALESNDGIFGSKADSMHVALRDHDVTLHTVFLSPPKHRHHHGNASPLSGRQSGLTIAAAKNEHRMSILFGVGASNSNNGSAGVAFSGSNANIPGASGSSDRMLMADSVSSFESDDRTQSGSSTVDGDMPIVPRRTLIRTRSETYLPPGASRHSKAGSFGGNFDLTVESPPPSAVSERVSRRSSNRSRLTNSLESATAADGQEKHIRKVLEKKNKELFPLPLPELGPKVTFEGRLALIDPRLRRGRSGETMSTKLNTWSPKGILVAHFTEHAAQVNTIRVAPDHGFFASCSDDGTVKIWDTNRLHTNVANRARLTYSGMSGARVKTIAFCEHRHSIASAGDNGQVHINRVEYIRSQTGSIKYTGYFPVRTFSVGGKGGSVGEYASEICHTETDTQSLLVYATTRGRLCALDLRSMREAWSFQVPPHFGAITALTMDRKGTWALTGTHRGVLCLWDIRFQLCTKSWAHPSRGRIYKLAPYPYRSASRAGMNAHGQLVAMAVGTPSGEVSVWNIASGECAELFCMVGDGNAMPSLSTPAASSIGMTAGPSTGPSASISSSGVTANATTTPSASGRALFDLNSELNRIYGNGPRAVASPAIHDLVDDMSSLSLYKLPKSGVVRTFAFEPDGQFMFTGGSDRRLRFWDLRRIESSFVVSGTEDDPAMVFKYGSQLRDDTNFHVEMRLHQHYGVGGAGNANSADADAGRSMLRQLPGMYTAEETDASRSSGHASNSVSGSGSSSMAGGGTSSASVGIGSHSGNNASGSHSSSHSADISHLVGGRGSWVNDRLAASKGAELLTSAVPRRHLDGITDLAFTRFPYPMVIAGGRDGIIKVWQ